MNRRTLIIMLFISNILDEKSVFCFPRLKNPNQNLIELMDHSDQLLERLARYPKHLSQWGIFKFKDQSLDLAQNHKFYDIVNPLFSDYASKFRTIYIPRGQSIKYKEGRLEFPNGTILSKTFSYHKSQLVVEGQRVSYTNPVSDRLIAMKDQFLIETRLLVKQEDAWVGLPYLWNRDQKDAVLKPVGKKLSMKLLLSPERNEEFFYKVPNMNQCKSCHTIHKQYKRTLSPIGPRYARNINLPIMHQGELQEQLRLWAESSMLTGLPDLSQVESLSQRNGSDTVVERARAYLDINCAHCHGSQGLARTTGLFLDISQQERRRLGVCKSPVAIGNGGGGRLFDLVPGRPEESILYYRLSSTEPSVMMPEVGRNLKHQEGMQLIYQWIKGMEGSCEMPE